MSEPTTKDAEAADPLIGQTLGGRFKVQSLIDRGGMGKIYKAEQQPLGRVVALKTMDVHDTTGEFRQRFFLEASVCAKLSHPNTVRVFDYGRHPEDGPEAGAIYYLVMELLTGGQLNQLTDQAGPLDPLRAMRLAKQIAGALAEAHEQGIVHRDLKPQNVFLTKHGEDGEFVKVVDFGLVKELGLESEVSKSGNVLGSPMYMAPEQVESQEIDARTDIYALGLILYSMLAGTTPFKRGNALAVMMQQVHKEPASFAEAAPGVKIPASLDWVVRTCIKKEKEKRFATMREVIRALRLVEREIRGEMPGIKFQLSDKGTLILPAGMEQDETTSAIIPMGARKADPSELSQSIVRSMARPAPLAAGLIGLVLLGGVGLIGLTLVIVGAVVLSSGTSADAHPQTPPPLVTTPTAPPTPPPEPVVTKVKVSVDSEPPGAEVSEGGAVIGNTPLELEVDPKTPRMLDLSASGHTGKQIRVDGSSTSVKVELPAEKAAPKQPRDPGTSRPPSNGLRTGR